LAFDAGGSSSRVERVLSRGRNRARLTRVRSRRLKPGPLLLCRISTILLFEVRFGHCYEALLHETQMTLLMAIIVYTRRKGRIIHYALQNLIDATDHWRGITPGKFGGANR